MCHVSHVTCHVSGVRCKVLDVTFDIFFFLMFLDKEIELVGGGLLSTGPTPSSLCIYPLTVKFEDLAIDDLLSCLFFEGKI